MTLRLDPRAKLYLLLIANALLFFHVSTATEMIMMGIFLAPFFLSGKYRSGLRFLILYSGLAAMDFLLIPIASGVLLHAVSMLSVGIRMMLPCLVSGSYAFTTTTPAELVCALRKMHIPEGIIITAAVVIRFFPTVLEDYRQIRNAMALRGVEIGWRHPMQSLEYVIIPLLMNGTNVAQDLSVASLTKGIGLPGRHTSMVQIQMKWYDFGYMALSAVPLALFLGGVL